MPVIKNYKQQIGGIGVQQRKSPGLTTTGEAQAKGIQQLAQVAGNVIEQQVGREERQNLSDLNVALSEANKQSSQELMNLQRNADTSDRDKFNKQFDDYNKNVKDRLSKVGESVKGRVSAQHFATSSANMTAQMEKGAFNLKADLQGEIAVKNEKTSSNNDMVTLSNNPAAFNSVLDAGMKRADLMLDLPAAKRIEYKTQIKAQYAQAAIRGWIKLDPEYAKNKISGEKGAVDPKTGKSSRKKNEYDGLLSGDQQRQLVGEANQAINAKRIEQERQLREMERARKKRINVIGNEYHAKMDEGTLSAKDVINNKELDAFGEGSKHQWLQMLKARNSRKAPTTNVVGFSNTFERIHLPDGDPKKITNETALDKLFIDEKLTYNDVKALRKELQGVGTVEGKIESSLKKTIFDSARKKLIKLGPGGMPIQDPEGDAMFSMFTADFMDSYQKGRDAGHSMRDLLTPGGKAYIGGMVDSYTRSLPEVMQSRSKAMKSAFKKKERKGLLPAKAENLERGAGESTDDYLKRIEAAEAKNKKTGK